MKLQFAPAIFLPHILAVFSVQVPPLRDTSTTRHVESVPNTHAQTHSYHDIPTINRSVLPTYPKADSATDGVKTSTVTANPGPFAPTKLRPRAALPLSLPLTPPPAPKINLDVNILSDQQSLLLSYGALNSSVCNGNLKCRDAMQALAGIQNILLGGAQLGGVIYANLIRIAVLPHHIFYGITQAKLRTTRGIIDWAVFFSAEKIKIIVNNIKNVLKIKLSKFAAFKSDLLKVADWCVMNISSDIKCKQSIVNLGQVILKGVETDSLCQEYVKPMSNAKSQCAADQKTVLALDGLGGTLSSICQAV